MIFRLVFEVCFRSFCFLSLHQYPSLKNSPTLDDCANRCVLMKTMHTAKIRPGQDPHCLMIKQSSGRKQEYTSTLIQYCDWEGLMIQRKR